MPWFPGTILYALVSRDIMLCPGFQGYYIVCPGFQGYYVMPWFPGIMGIRCFWTHQNSLVGDL